MEKKKRWAFIITILLSTIALGYLREYVFVSLNERIAIGDDPAGNLMKAKWALTILCSVVYLAITCLFIRVLFKKIFFVWLAIFIYLFLFGVSFSAMGIGYFTNHVERVYPFARTVMGIAQSPIVLMILIPTCLVYTMRHDEKMG